MKKFISTMLIFVLLITMSTICMAAPAPKVASVSVSASDYVVNVNEIVYLTATALKQGSGYTDSWSGASKVSTNLNSDGYYISNATFSSSVPGTYELYYDISMNAGKSGVTFEGKSQKIVITVVKPSIVIGAVVKNVNYTDVYQLVGKDNTPKLVGVDAVGDVYAVWDNGVETPTYTTAMAHFGNGQVSGSQKSVAVSFELEGVTYSNYTVTFIKP